MSREDWEGPAEEISTKTLDIEISYMQELRKKYEATKEVASEASAEYETQKELVLELLERAKKTKYSVDGLGTVNVLNKYMVKTPKELMEKRDFFAWIENRYGKDVLDGMVSINSQTLNSFVNEVKEADAQIEIPGLGAPSHKKEIRFTVKK